MKNNLLLLLLAVLGLAWRPAAGQPKYKVVNLNSPKLKGTVLSLSDIHFALPDDPLLLDSLISKDVSQWKRILQKDKAVAQYGFSPPFDTHYPLLAQALDDIARQCPAPDFIVITGDHLAHYFPKDLPLITKTYRFLAGQIQARYPATIVLPGLGNNDSDTGNYELPTLGFLKMFAQTWLPLLHTTPAADSEFVRSFRNLYGCYSFELPGGAKPGQGNRLLMLNSVAFCYDSSPPLLNRHAAKAELRWLRDELKKPGYAHAWLAMHVPFGVDVYKSLPSSPPDPSKPGGRTAITGNTTPMWLDSVTTAYLDIVGQHAGRISAGLAGHTHMNEFRLSYQVVKTDTVISSFLHLTPSISPFFGNNPGFQVLSYDTTSMVLRNSRTYYTQIADDNHDWRLGPQAGFDATYGIKTITAASLDSVRQRLKGFSPLYQAQYAIYFSDSTTYSKFYGNKTYSYRPPTSQLLWPYYWCATRAMGVADYDECVCKYLCADGKQLATQANRYPVRRPTKLKVKTKLARVGTGR